MLIVLRGCCLNHSSVASAQMHRAMLRQHFFTENPQSYVPVPDSDAGDEAPEASAPLQPRRIRAQMSQAQSQAQMTKGLISSKLYMCKPSTWNFCKPHSILISLINHLREYYIYVRGEREGWA